MMVYRGAFLLIILMIISYNIMAQNDFNSIKGSLEDTIIDIDINNTSFLYNVHVENLMGSTMPVKIEINTGPDYENKNLQYCSSTTINLNPHETKIVPFYVPMNINLLPECEFRQWLLRENDSIWQRLWFNIDIVPAMGTPIKLRNQSMSNIGLMKSFWRCISANVDPIIGNKDNLFNYKLELESSAEDQVTLEVLQVAPNKSSEWIDKGSQIYNQPGRKQTLRWNNIKLRLDPEGASYRFVGKKHPPTGKFEGPFPYPNISIKNIKVSPTDGLANHPYVYSIEFNASYDLNVELNVWDENHKRFRSIGTKEYLVSPAFRPLQWYNVSFDTHNDLESKGKYYFKVYHDKIKSSIWDTYNNTGLYFPGPNITKVIIQDATVVQPNGSLSDTYIYTANVKFINKSDLSKVKLEIYDPSARNWISIDVAPKIDWSKISYIVDLDNVTFSSYYIGNLKFKFVSGTQENCFDGPNIFINYRNYDFNNDERSYSVEVNSSLCNLPIDLKYQGSTLPQSPWHLLDDVKNYTHCNSWQRLEWTNIPEIASSLKPAVREDKL